MRSLTACIYWSPNSETRSCLTFFHHACWLSIAYCWLFITPVTHVALMHTAYAHCQRIASSTHPPSAAILSVCFSEIRLLLCFK